MLNDSLVFDVFDAALKTGGDFAELFVEKSVKNTVSVVNGVCESSMAGLDYGIGLRVFCGHNAIYAYTNDDSCDSLTDIARRAAAACGGDSTGRKRNYTFTTETVNDLHAPRVLPDIANKPEIKEALIKAHQTAVGVSPEITQTVASYADCVSDIMVYTSDGAIVPDKRTRTRLHFTVVAGDGSLKQTASLAPGSAMGYEFFKEFDIDKTVLEICESALIMLSAGYAPGGRMPVVVDGGFGGVIFHEACGHSLEATSVAKGASVFCDKLGEVIANEVVTAIDDATLPHRFGSVNIDDEGIRARRNVLIENGVLKSYLVDKLNGLKLNLPPTGSSRRESYRFAPTSRMTNTFIAPGKSTLNEMIASIDYGLYAKKMGGGSVNPATGEFNFAVSEGYLIKDGKILKPVRGATIIGTGEACLKNIDMVGGELTLAEGVCGSASGRVPVCVGQPPIRVTGLTVGGRD